LAGAIYLAPTPVEPFVRRIAAVASLFPDSPPYEGQIDRPVPHLTVAQAEKATLSRIQADSAERAMRFLPLYSLAREVRLIDNSEVQWKTRRLSVGAR
jgi:hypothetical protein